MSRVQNQYDFSGKTVMITGGTGVLGRAITSALLECNAQVVLLSRKPELAEKLVQGFEKGQGKCIVVAGDVLQKATLERAAQRIRDECGRLDCLINAAGGNDPKATTNQTTSFFDLPEPALRFVADLNLLGTILPSQVFGRMMSEQKDGVILNVTSMAAFRPLTRVGAYAAAKAAVSNFTQWLAVYLAREYSAKIRVNAIAPGFFLTEQNRFLLTEEGTGRLTERGQKIIDHTPMGRFGQPEDLVGAVLWLLSPASGFVTGIVVPVDGGFSAYTGV
jgi:NAD(P)-dependent dehydrogenase (short-subunit alcohol dehydrogenase family)